MSRLDLLKKKLAETADDRMVEQPLQLVWKDGAVQVVEQGEASRVHFTLMSEADDAVNPRPLVVSPSDPTVHRCDLPEKYRIAVDRLLKLDQWHNSFAFLFRQNDEWHALDGQGRLMAFQFILSALDADVGDVQVSRLDAEEGFKSEKETDMFSRIKACLEQQFSVYELTGDVNSLRMLFVNERKEVEEEVGQVFTEAQALGAKLRNVAAAVVLAADGAKSASWHAEALSSCGSTAVFWKQARPTDTDGMPNALGETLVLQWHFLGGVSISLAVWLLLQLRRQLPTVFSSTSTYHTNNSGLHQVYSIPVEAALGLLAVAVKQLPVDVSLDAIAAFLTKSVWHNDRTALQPTFVRAAEEAAATTAKRLSDDQNKMLDLSIRFGLLTLLSNTDVAGNSRMLRDIVESCSLSTVMGGVPLFFATKYWIAKEVSGLKTLTALHSSPSALSDFFPNMRAPFLGPAPTVSPAFLLPAKDSCNFVLSLVKIRWCCRLPPLEASSYATAVKHLDLNRRLKGTVELTKLLASFNTPPAAPAPQDDDADEEGDEEELAKRKKRSGRVKKSQVSVVGDTVYIDNKYHFEKLRNKYAPEAKNIKSVTFRRRRPQREDSPDVFVMLSDSDAEEREPKKSKKTAGSEADQQPTPPKKAKKNVQPPTPKKAATNKKKGKNSKRNTGV